VKSSRLITSGDIELVAQRRHVNNENCSVVACSKCLLDVPRPARWSGSPTTQEQFVEVDPEIHVQRIRTTYALPPSFAAVTNLAKLRSFLTESFVP
jgi:hypothetical protein